MKVLPGNEPKIPTVERSRHTSNGKGSISPDKSASFGAILHEAQKTSLTQGIQKTQSVRVPFGTPTLSPEQELALGLGEETLDLLEHIQKGIQEDMDLDGENGKTLAEILLERTHDLISVRDALNHQDPLKDTIDAIGTRTVVEAYKLTRGDY